MIALGGLNFYGVRTIGNTVINFPLYESQHGDLKRYTGACTNISADTSNVLKSGDSNPSISVTLHKTTPLYVIFTLVISCN